MEPKTTGKRIVSKGEYVAIQGKRTGILLMGITLFALAVVVLFGAMSVAQTRLQQYSWGHLYMAHDDKSLSALASDKYALTVSPRTMVWSKRLHSFVTESVEYQAEIDAGTISHPKWWLENAMGLIGVLLGIFLLVRLVLVSIKHVESIVPAIPLTRANINDLPAPDSLVRASSEPMQVQEGVLLRGAEGGQERHEEQLLRAAVGQESIQRH